MVNSLNQARKRPHPVPDSVEQEPERLRSNKGKHKTKAVLSHLKGSFSIDAYFIVCIII